jgi:hypothetical protein
VSKLAERVVKYYFNNPGGPKPTWLKRKGSVRDYLRDYFEFPTPGKAAGNIESPDVKSFLYRWHKEYQYLCEYSHVSLGKMVLQTMSGFKDVRSAEKVETLGTKHAERAMFISYTAAASSCAQITKLLSESYGETDQLRSFWDQLQNSSLLSKALWEMHIKNLLS